MNRNCGSCRRNDCDRCTPRPIPNVGSGTFKFSGLIAIATVLTSSYLADEGIGAVASFFPQHYPSGLARTFRTLAVKINAALSVGDDLALTVFKNGVATALTIPITSAALPGTVIIATLPAGIAYAPTDTFDLVATTSVLAIATGVSATLQ